MLGPTTSVPQPMAQRRDLMAWPGQARQNDREARPPDTHTCFATAVQQCGRQGCCLCDVEQAEPVPTCAVPCGTSRPGVPGAVTSGPAWPQRSAQQPTLRGAPLGALEPRGSPTCSLPRSFLRGALDSEGPARLVSEQTRLQLAIRCHQPFGGL